MTTNVDRFERKLCAIFAHEFEVLGKDDLRDLGIRLQDLAAHYAREATEADQRNERALANQCNKAAEVYQFAARYFLSAATGFLS